MSSLPRVINSYIDSFEDQLYTSMPAIVEAYYPDECSADVFPAIYKVRNSDGLKMKYGLLQRVPVEFPSVSDAAITFPITKGDKVMLHFCNTNIDNFFLTEDEFVDPKTNRHHDLNDAFITVGLRKFSDTPVKRQDTLDIYYKDSRLTFEETGNITLQHKKDDIDSIIEVKSTGEISLSNNKESSNVVLKSNGDIAGVTKSKFSMANADVELVDALSRLAEQVAAITVNTTYGPTPINNKAAVEAIKSEVDTMKE